MATASADSPVPVTPYTGFNADPDQGSLRDRPHPDVGVDQLGHQLDRRPGRCSPHSDRERVVLPGLGDHLVAVGRHRPHVAAGPGQRRESGDLDQPDQPPVHRERGLGVPELGDPHRTVGGDAVLLRRVLGLHVRCRRPTATHPSRSSSSPRSVRPAPSRAHAVSFDVIDDTGENYYYTNAHPDDGLPFPNGFNPDQASLDAPDRAVRRRLPHLGGRHRLQRDDAVDLRRPPADRHPARGQQHLRALLLPPDRRYPDLRRARGPRPEHQPAQDLSDVDHRRRLGGDLRLRQLRRDRRDQRRVAGHLVRLLVGRRPDLRARRRLVGRPWPTSWGPRPAACAVPPARHRPSTASPTRPTPTSTGRPVRRSTSGSSGISPSIPVASKFAVFHYPLRSDNATQPSDVYLQNSPANPNASTSLEDAAVGQRGAGGLQRPRPHLPADRAERSGPDHQLRHRWRGRRPGARARRAATCANLTAGTSPADKDIYAIGWDPTKNTGSSCSTNNTAAAAGLGRRRLQLPQGHGERRHGDRHPLQRRGRHIRRADLHLPGHRRADHADRRHGGGDIHDVGRRSSWAASTEAGRNHRLVPHLSQRFGPGHRRAGHTTFTDTGAQHGTTYTYSVAAVDTGGQASWPGVANQVTTPAPAPVQPRIRPTGLLVPSAVRCGGGGRGDR